MNFKLTVGCEEMALRLKRPRTTLISAANPLKPHLASVHTSHYTHLRDVLLKSGRYFSDRPGCTLYF